ncbi:MAG TPA: ATP-binding protein, partial [Exilispira sp.]|nr:ATP-binding protein [Exilispira sp.]
LKLNQIVYNLLGNAVKFNSNGYIALIIKLEDRSKDVVKISICIKDTGIGIAEENLQHIFDPFVQENELIKEKYGGTGLGLSIVKEFIELMGGSIHCTSKKNEGTTFSVFLTFSLPKIEEKKEHIESFVDQIVFKNSSLLVIEDNAVNQEIIRSYLKKYDTLKLTICNNGLEGLEKLSKDEYNLVLCDINMPVMNGKEFCIKAKKIYPDLPIIALTAHDSVEEKNELIQLGFNDIISKPYNRAGIIRGITRYIPVKKEINNKNYDETEMNKIEKQENCRNLTENKENSLESRISTINHEEIDKGDATFVDNSGFSEREKEVFIKLHEYLNNNKELMSYQRLFLTDLLNFYKKLKDGIEKKDKEQLKYFTHNLKGTAPMIGYNEFTDFALEVSNLYKQDRFDELQKYKEIMLSIIEKIVER